MGHVSMKSVCRIPIVDGVGPDKKTKQIHPDHPDLATGTALLMEALGTTNGAFLEGIIMQLAHATSRGREVNLKSLNFMLSMVTGIEPKDQTEAMLGAQMGAVHMQMMTFARRLSNADTYLESEMAEKAFNKLARTFAAQMEALIQLNYSVSQNNDFLDSEKGFDR